MLHPNSHGNYSDCLIDATQLRTVGRLDGQRYKPSPERRAFSLDPIVSSGRHFWADWFSNFRCAAADRTIEKKKNRRAREITRPHINVGAPTARGATENEKLISHSNFI